MHLYYQLYGRGDGWLLGISGTKEEIEQFHTAIHNYGECDTELTWKSDNFAHLITSESQVRQFLRVYHETVCGQNPRMEYKKKLYISRYMGKIKYMRLVEKNLDSAFNPVSL